MAYAARATANLFTVLGIPPRLGRSFTPEEETPGRDRVVSLSRRVWFRRHAGDPDIIGRAIRTDGKPHKVIGVMPESFNECRHLGMIDFFRPLAFSRAQASDRRDTLLRVIARPSVNQPLSDIESFDAEFGAGLTKGFPGIDPESSWRADLLPGTIAGKTAKPMFNMMLALSGLVLLIACSNLANLLLASGVRLALSGCLLDVLGGFGACRLIASLTPGMQMNSTSVLLGSTLLLLAVAMLACWLPARRASKVDPVDALRTE